MSNQELQEFKIKVNLPMFAKEYLGIESLPNGKFQCPFHPPDNHPSCSFWKNGNDEWLFTDYHDGFSGSIIDLVVKLKGYTLKEAIEWIRETHESSTSKNQKFEIETTYDYIKEGLLIFQKVRYRPKRFVCRQPAKKEGEWIYNLDGIDPFLYRCDEVIQHSCIWIVEGEKDVETLRKMGFVATTAPFGVGNWRSKYTQCFKGKKEVFICLDKGCEDIAVNRAEEISIMAKEVKIIKLPDLTKEGQDITDWLEMMGDVSDEEKRNRLYEVILTTPIFNSTTGSKIETLRELRDKEIPAREVFLQNWIERESLTILGGEQKVGKSIITLNIAISLAKGCDFLGFAVPKPRKVLLYQQEISPSAMKERIIKMINNDDSPLLDNFLIKNTTGKLLKVTDSRHRNQIYEDIEENNPDLVIFDPLSTFHNKKENDAKEMSGVLDCFFEIINKFKVGIFIIHHYGKPSLAQRYGSHLLRGSSVIGDRADAIIVFNRLPDKYKNSPLPYPYDHYAEIQFVLRNDASPNNLIVERNPERLWYNVYDLYGQLGRKILPEQVKSIIIENGGQILQSELMEILLEQASRKVAFKALQEAKEKYPIESEVLPRKGSPVQLKLNSEENF